MFAPTITNAERKRTPVIITSVSLLVEKPLLQSFSDFPSLCRAQRGESRESRGEAASCAEVRTV